MKISRRALVIWPMLYIVGWLSQACDPCEGGPIRFRLTSTTGMAYRLAGLEQPSPPSYRVELYEVGKAVRYDSVGLEVMHELQGVTARGSFFSSAYACDPAVDFPCVSSIRITSSQDYQALFPAGSDLSAIITAREGRGVQGLPFNNFLSPFGPSLERAWFFTFDVPPSGARVHDFTIVYEMADGTEVTTEIRQVTISP